MSTADVSDEAAQELPMLDSDRHSSIVQQIHSIQQKSRYTGDARVQRVQYKTHASSIRRNHS